MLELDSGRADGRLSGLKAKTAFGPIADIPVTLRLRAKYFDCPP